MRLLSTTLVVLTTLLVQASADSEKQKKLGDVGEIHRKKENPFDEELRKLAEESLDYWNVPGVAIGVVDGDKDFSVGYGYATYPSVKASPSTLWLAGSTSKAFTAAAMGLLIQNSSELSWKTPLSSIIRDDFVLEDSYATEKITIEDALSHRTGMPRHDKSYGSTDGTKDFSIKKAVRSLRYLPLSAELRTKYQYCNLMYVAIAHVVETVSSMQFSTFLRSNILQPLGMNSTYFTSEDAHAAKEDFARGYYYNKTGSSFGAIPDFNLTQATGAGSIVSNVLDYQKWIRSWIFNTGPVAGLQAQLIQPRAITGNEPSSERSNAYDGPALYALGWEVGTYRGVKFHTHTGGMEGFGTNLIIFPSLKWGSIGFANTASVVVQMKLQWKLIDDMLNVPEAERFDFDRAEFNRSKKQQKNYDSAQQTFFPKIPSPPLPASAPLSAYTGTYNHPGYGNMTLYINSASKLQIDRLDATWQVKLELDHVSGDYFLGNLDSLKAPQAFFTERSPVEFRLQADGSVSQFGIGIEQSLGKEKIWFERI